ncbi:hypothetical protein ILUMI_22155 [Ignelater luminosus]|uniref:Serpin domain-containing protein n=1 Tax=Ignelater luminosus TaxID=2038154 RepID=A0A8K0G0T4_IGNLU|nr:hypothetical protein ILUMI_22155 [Ignelater luminosus]
MASKYTRWFEEFSRKYEEFVINVYKEVAETHINNFVVCPLSLHALLGYTYFCTTGETAQQIAYVLNLTSSRGRLPSLFQDRISFLMDPSRYVLNNVSALCVKRDFEVKDTYKQIGTNCFGTKVHNINFKNKSKSVKQINKWIEKKTCERIQKIIFETDIHSHTRAMLINAICFQGRWRLQFRKENTKKRRFFLRNHAEVQTDMMETTDYFNYSVNRDLQAIFLEVPYEGNDITMTLVLPMTIDGLSTLEDNIEAILAQSHCLRRVYVAIPKFRIKSSMQFQSMLEKVNTDKLTIASYVC